MECTYNLTAGRGDAKLALEAFSQIPSLGVSRHFQKLVAVESCPIDSLNKDPKEKEASIT